MDDVAPRPAKIYLQLRERIFNLKPADMDLKPTQSAPHVWGMVMETGYPVGTATLVSLADGTTSLYYSTGGGMLGSGEYDPVAEASRTWVAQAENHLQHVSGNDEFPLPEMGQVRFIILTYDGTLSDEALEEKLAAGEHRLSPLYKQAHEILEQLRVLAEKKRAEPQ